MAMPRDIDFKKTYYHGTSTKRAYESIKKKGITPGNITTQHHGAQMQPAFGKVYITPSIRYAIIYAVEGDILGSDHVFTKWIDEPTGYVFEISGKSLRDIEPDEDSVGEFVWKKKPEWLYNLARRELTSRQFEKVMDGEYGYWASSGKKLNKIMSDKQKLELIDMGAHIAHTGKIKPSAVWTFNKTQANPQFKKDGSNFFKIAKRTKL